MVSTAQLVFAFYLLLTSSLVLYVYRFAVAGVNLSAFRVLLLAWMAWCAADIVRGRIRPERKYWPLLGMVSALVVINAVDFLALAEHGALRRDIANHLLNLVFAILVSVYVDTEPRRVALLRAFVLSSLVTSAISVYSAFTDRLPFESAIRTLGSEQGRALAYISDDSFFERATAAFFDPNFYGVYSLLVLLAAMYLWLYARPSRSLAVLFVLNLVCLGLTLSRTGLVGTIWAMGLTFLLSRRSRLFAVATSIAAVGLLYASTTVQSHQGRKQLLEQGAAAWTYWTTPAPDDTAARTDGVPQPPRDDRRGGRGSEMAPGPSTGASPSGSETRRPSLSTLSAATSVASARLADGKSVEGRLQHIRQGLAVFRSSPVYGRGSAALLGPHTSWASAHVSYLTLLARYGLIGLVAYLAFLLYPLVTVWRRPSTEAHRFFVSVVTGTLFVVYLGYDILLFFEIQYLFFGLFYSIVQHQVTTPSAGERPTAV